MYMNRQCPAIFHFCKCPSTAYDTAILIIGPVNVELDVFYLHPCFLPDVDVTPSCTILFLPKWNDLRSKLSLHIAKRKFAASKIALELLFHLPETLLHRFCDPRLLHQFGKTPVPLCKHLMI